MKSLSCVSPQCIITYALRLKSCEILFSMFFAQFVPFMMETIRALPLIAFPVVYFLEGDEMWVTIGVLSYFGILLFYSAMAMIPTGAEKPGLLEKIIR